MSVPNCLIKPSGIYRRSALQPTNTMSWQMPKQISTQAFNFFYDYYNAVSNERVAGERGNQCEACMIIRRFAFVACCLGLSSVIAILHAEDRSEPMALTPSEMRWQAQGALAQGGIEQANLVGDPTKPGPYTVRLKFPAGYRLAPHTHPDSREVTILSGTWNTGYGEKFEETALKTLPAGSFYTEPANIPHFVEVREPVLIQVSGKGPSGRMFVKPAASPK
jgi:quercetin dioxygenase-like cupin family protein